MIDEKNRRLLGILFLISIAISVPSIIRIPRFVPFLDAGVRAAAPKALEELRSQGLWLVNVDMQSVQRDGKVVCFLWEHRYRSRMTVHDPEFITTCIE